MKHIYSFLAVLLIALAPLGAMGQDPFGGKTKKVYIFNAGLMQIMSDYAAMTPKTYSLKLYSPVGLEQKVFELTEIDAAAGTYVLYTPGTASYMKVPAGPGIVSTTEVTAERTPIVVKQNEDGTYQLRSQAGHYIAPYANGKFYMLGALNETQFNNYCKPEWDAWDFVEPEVLLDYLKAHDIDPDYDPYAPVIKYSYDNLADLMIQAEEVFFCVEGGVVAEGEPLIQSAEQLSSAYSDEEEGTDLFALIDEEPTTYWHSNWHEEAIVPEGNHSFEVRLPAAPADGLYYAQYTGRLYGNNSAPVQIYVRGAQLQGTELQWEGQPFAHLTRADGLGAYAGWGHSSFAEYLSGHFSFQAPKKYDALRFEVAEVVGDDAEAPYFTYSEFQLFEGRKEAPTLYAPAEQIEALRQIYDEAKNLVETIDPTDTFNALYDALEAVELQVIPSGINGLSASSASASQLYDLAGRALKQQPSAGIYVQGGKVVIK